VTWIGEHLVEFGDGDGTDAGLFEIEEVNRFVNDAMQRGSVRDRRAAMREAEQMRRLVASSRDMYRGLIDQMRKAGTITEDASTASDDWNGNMYACRECNARVPADEHELTDPSWHHHETCCLPGLDVDLEASYGWEPQHRRTEP
jgi:hypothetical protein